jgi:ectoine hydroxylase-related dioxygenase (phytanoyl-CoA dioxygenase family)
MSTASSTSTPRNSIAPIRLTDAQRADFARDGYVVLGRILDDAQLQRIRDDEARLRSTIPYQDPATTHFWGQALGACPGARDLALDGPHLSAVSDIIGDDVALWWNQFVTKLPDGDQVRGEFTWHQDNGYKDVAPGTNVTVWCALDDVDTHNGCVWFQPGSHKAGLLPHHRPKAESWHLQVPVEGDGVAAPMRAGEAVMFSAYTLHRSKANLSQAPRRAFFLEYAHADAVLPGEGGVRVRTTPEAWVVRGKASP